MLLNINNLTIELRKDNVSVPLCKNISFSLNTCQTLGILGESGSGKSLTALSIPQLLAPALQVTQGQILFTKKDESIVDLTTNSLAIKQVRGAEIGVVFQEPMSSLNPVFTCGMQVAEVLKKHLNYSDQEAYTSTLQLFEKVKLPDPPRIFRSYPHQLSGGQKQRVMIAMAISCKPRLLIADEPTTALDVTVQKSILDLLKELQTEMGMSIIFITHDISVLAHIAANVLILYKGEIVEKGLVKDILVHPQHEYTKHLINCRQLRLNQQNQEIQDTNNAILSVKNICLSYQTKPILKNISFNVYPGETIGLVGESGSGKTTIGRAIMQLSKTSAGEIFFQNQNILNSSHNQLKTIRQKIQIIFQDPFSSLNPKHTIGDAILEPMIVHNLYKTTAERKKRVFELLEMVHLQPEHVNRYPHQFSGGQRQRIGIARALAVNPQLIILDESVAALDVSIQAQILSLLTDLKKKLKLTYIFISHDLDVVKAISDRIIVLQHGQIVETGTPSDLFTNPQHPYTTNLIASIP